MWHVIAEEDMRCTECNHEIPAGGECISQMPLVMPEHFRRKKYENFCIECAECKRKNKQPCYVRRLSHWYSSEKKADVAVPCAHCGQTIPKDTRTVAQKFYVWPISESESENEQSNGRGTGMGARAAGVAVAGAAKRANSGAWHNLSPGTRRLFRTRGLGRGLGLRSPKMAQKLYERSIPEAIRNQGEGAVLSFLKGKHFSHIKSVSKMPGWAKRPSNIIIEKASRNLSRGSRNMTAAEVATAKSAGRASEVGATVKGAAKNGIIAAAIEAPIAGLENFFHWKRGRISRDQAVKDTAKSTAGAGAVAVGSTAAVAGVTKGAAMVGISPTLGPAGIPLAVAGVGLMFATAAYRIFKASKHDLPLDEYLLFFCKDRDCKIRYARDVANAAGNSTFPWTWVLALTGLVVAIAFSVSVLT